MTFKTLVRVALAEEEERVSEKMSSILNMFCCRCFLEHPGINIKFAVVTVHLKLMKEVRAGGRD